MDNGQNENLKNGFFQPSRDETVLVPAPLKKIFDQAQAMVHDFFRGARSDPSEGTIEIDGDRYILVRASALSTNFIDTIIRVYADRGPEEAEAIGRGLLFDLAHTIGLNDARNLHRKMGLTDPIEKLSAGPVHFAYAGWAFVDIRPESNPVPSDDFVIMYDHPYSFEAHTWLAAGRKSEHPVCVMNAGYSSGWCEESFGIPLTAVEVTCRAKGDAKCTFLMAPPHRIVERVREYFGINIKDQIRKGLSIPAYFERKVAEDKLRDSERMFRAVVDQTYQFIGLLKTDGTLIDVNETALAFSGIVKSDVMNKPFWEGPWWTHSPELQDKVRDAVKRTAAGDFVRFEATHPAKDGSMHYVDFSMKPVRDEEGKIIMLLPEGRDITERKQAEDKLRDSERMFRAVVDQTYQFIGLLKTDGTLIDVNETALAFSGIVKSDVMNKPFWEGPWWTHSPELQEKVRDAVKRTAQGDFVRFEATHPAKDGSLHYIDFSMKPVHDDEGRIIMLLPEGRDITERKQAEDKLRKSERMFRAVVDQTYQFIGLLKTDGTLIDVNETALAFSGIVKSDVMNKPFWEGPWWTHSPELQEKVRDAVKRTAQGDFVRFEATHPAKDGSLHYVDFSMKPVHDTEGRIIMLLPEGRDITDRKAMEEALRAERDKAQQYLNIAGVIMVVLNPDQTIALINKKGCGILGWAEAELVGANWFDRVVPEAERALVKDAFQNLMAGDVAPVEHYENSILTKNGDTRIIAWYNTILRDEKRRIIGTLSSGEDITERKKTEAALKESEERFSQIVNRAVVGVFRTALDGMALLANPAVMKMFDFDSVESFNAAGGVTNFYQNLEDRQRLFAEIMKGPVYGMEIPFYRRDRSVMILSLSAKLVRDDKGNPLFIEGTLEDVTRRQEAEQQLQHTMAELKRSNRELEEFASVASHDLQEPLRKILTFSDRIKSRSGAALDQESQDYFGRMQNAASRMQNLINDLLSYSRVTTQAKPFVSVNLDELAHDVLVDLELRIRPGLDRVDIADLPTIEADPGQIRQLLYNLISNALKFRRADQPALVKVEGGIDKDRCLIRVRDNGIGFDEKYRESIFGIFKRLHSRAEYEGTGVGLAICKKIVERHGGSITAYSTPGQGATFEAVLPQRH